VNGDDIGGIVTSSKGPEAGVWVIAETTDLPTKFRKIVVTDDAGRYLLPELPQANYKIWVRGYGLVDSKPVESVPGKTLALTAIIAPSLQAAAQYYPGVQKSAQAESCLADRSGRYANRRKRNTHRRLSRRCKVRLKLGAYRRPSRRYESPGRKPKRVETGKAGG
jgi:hypothetical protein